MRRLGIIGLTAFAFVALAVPTAQATLPGSNGRFLYTTGNYLSHLDLYSVCPDGTGVKMIASGAREGQYSPDGKRIVYSSGGGHFPNFAMVVADADGSNSEAVFAGFGEEDMPSWSPDGEQIAFHSRWSAYPHDDETSSPGNTPYLIDLSSKTPTPLLKSDVVGVASFTQLSWSPDGERIYFVGVDHDGNQAVYWAPTSQGNATKIDGTDGAVSLDVSPDGQRMVISKRVDDDWSIETWRYEIDGSGGLKLSDQLAANHRAGASGYQFSPDGTKLFFWRYGETAEGDYLPSEQHPAVSNLDGSGEMPLTSLPPVSTWTNNTDGCEGHMALNPPASPTASTGSTESTSPESENVAGKALARVKLATSGLLDRSKRTASIGLKCEGAACNGRFEFTLLGRKHLHLGGARYTMPAGGSSTAQLRISSTGARAIRRQKLWKHLKVRVSIVGDRSSSMSSTLTFVQRD